MTSKQRDELLLAMARMLAYENRTLHMSPMGAQAYEILQRMVAKIDKANPPRRNG